MVWVSNKALEWLTSGRASFYACSALLCMQRCLFPALPPTVYAADWLYRLS